MLAWRQRPVRVDTIQTESFLSCRLVCFYRQSPLPPRYTGSSSLRKPHSVVPGEHRCPPSVPPVFSRSPNLPRPAIYLSKVVGNTYTIAAEHASEDNLGDVWVELGLRARDVRVRCLFQYGRDGEGGSATVQRVFLAREGLGRLPLADGKIEVGRSERMKSQCLTTWTAKSLTTAGCFLEGSYTFVTVLGKSSKCSFTRCKTSI